MSSERPQGVTKKTDVTNETVTDRKAPIICLPWKFVSISVHFHHSIVHLSFNLYLHNKTLIVEKKLIFVIFVMKSKNFSSAFVII